MVIASEPGWLHAAGQAAGTILLLELGLALFIILALMLVLAVSAWWVKGKVVPVLREYAPKAEKIMSTTQYGTDRVVRGIAEFYGRRQQIETGLRVLLFGKRAAEQVRENALAKATADLDMMTPTQEGPAPDDGWTSLQRPTSGEAHSATGRPAGARITRRLAVDDAAPSSERGFTTWRPHQEDHRERGTDVGDDGFGDVAGNAS